jgi:hypothetical protein
MFANRELTRLSLRKAELLADSDALRGKLLQDWAKLRPTVAWVEGGMRLTRRIRPLLLVAAPLLGFWLARKGQSGLGGWWRKLLVGWRLWRSVAAVWRNLAKDKT